MALLSLVVVTGGIARAQLAPQAGATQPAAANPLPLSGRGGQGGSVNTVTSPIPGAVSSVNTLNTSVQVQGPYAGSRNGTASKPFSGKLSFREAIQRGLTFNLGTVGLNEAVRQVHGQSAVARAALLPNLNAAVSETVQQTNLRALGLRINSPFPGVAIPSVVGPFNYFDLRARLSQTVFNATQRDNYRSTKEQLRAAEETARDARDLVILAVGGAYLQVVAAQARVRAEQAQLNTAKALFDQATQQRAAGVLSLTDLNRSEVQWLTERQRLASLENDLSKQKINLARLTGLPPVDSFDITDDAPFTPIDDLNEESALKEAENHRADLKAAEAQLRAARWTHAAARAERLPSLAVNADYGAIGTNPSQSHGTFSVVGTLTIPIWQGGRTEGEIEQADAAMTQRRAEWEDLRAKIEAEIKNAFLDLRAAAQQVAVAQRNIEVAKQNLDLTRQRFRAGVTENLELVQAQQSLASAELDYVNSVFAHNVAKLALARAMGASDQNVARFLSVP